MSNVFRALNRRSLFPGFAGLTAAVGGLFTKFGKSDDGFQLVAQAHAEGAPGVRAKQGNLAHISGAKVPAQQMAEWAAGGAGRGPNAMAVTANGMRRAPAEASRYEAKVHNYPCGQVTVLTFKKGAPVHHQIAFETSIYVLQGSTTLIPLRGLAGKPIKINAGDGLYLPSGILTDAKAASDLVVVLFTVANPKPGAKQSIVTAKQAKDSEIAQWIVDGKEFSARTPAEIKAAPKNASRYITKLYEFDGNSFRVATLKKGTRTNMVAPTRSDVLMYVAKGSAVRKEAGESFQISAGDTFRERMNKPGSWEALEDLLLIATDAPPNTLPEGTGWTNTVAKAASTGTTLYEMSIDHNNRSTIGVVNVPTQTVSPLEAVSAKQDAVGFRIGYRPFLPYTRTDANYASDNGPTWMGVGGPPHFVARMVGTTENTMQDGAVFRQSAGEFFYCRPASLHNSNQNGVTPGVVMNVMLPGTEDSTGPLVVK